MQQLDYDVTVFDPNVFPLSKRRRVLWACRRQILLQSISKPHPRPDGNTTTADWTVVKGKIDYRERQAKNSITCRMPSSLHILQASSSLSISA